MKKVDLSALMASTPVQPRWGGLIACSCEK